MSFSESVSQAVPFLIVILVIIAIWAVIELALTIRRVRKTLDEVDSTVAKVDPLVDHVTLTVDALNLEIMRVDKILEDVGQVTDVATTAASAVSNATSAPIEFATSIADKIRLGLKSRSKNRAISESVKQVQLEREQHDALPEVDISVKSLDSIVIEPPVSSKK